MSDKDPQKDFINVSGEPALDPGRRMELENSLSANLQTLSAMDAGAAPESRANLLFETGEIEFELQDMEQAWNHTREAFSLFVNLENWQKAVESCNILYQTGQAASITALGHGIWLAVTYPVDPELTIVMLEHLIDESPDHSDGAAVAAMTAHYVAGLRAKDEKQAENFSFITGNLLARVAERHSQVKSQEALDMWLEKLELRQPQLFIERLGKVVNVIVGDHWWIDRDALRAKLPIQ